jgi:Ca2+-binding EF-hand superfamily protein
MMAMGGNMGMLGMVKQNSAGGPRPPMSRVIFNKYDLDEDGVIDAGEFKFMCRDLGHQLSEEEEKFAVLKVDKSGTGKICYDDFLEWWKTDEKWDNLRLSDEDLMNLSMILCEFQAFDANDDGIVEADEFKEMYESLQAGGVEKPLETVLAEMDVSGDGKIVFNEYVRWLNNNAVDKVKMSCAAHAAATARANAEYMETGIEEGAAPEDVCPPTVIMVDADPAP